MINLNFEKLFASQIAKIQEGFPENVVNSLWSKKEALEKEVSDLNLSFEDENIIPFVPVIPTRIMNCVDQLGCFTGAPRELLYYCTKDFMYNEGLTTNLSQVSEVGFILGVKCLPLSDIKIPQNVALNEIRSAIGKEISKIGYMPVNHVEALAVACMTKTLRSSSAFLAINSSWDGFSFPQIFNGRDMKYGFGWLEPKFDKDGECETENAKEVLIPVFQKIV